MRVHLIAIGGSAMHNLALALYEKGYAVTGSDDEIFEPSYSRLKDKGLLPEAMGWYPEKITAGIDAVILGMHARGDNPELQKAKELGLNIYSYPEFLYEQNSDKLRVVIGGSHGKTTITSMIMHVLKHAGMDFNYLVGAQVEGFDTMVRLSDTAKAAVFEGDEYLSSVLDPRPKFHLYRPNIAVISGIAWDHINVFPTFENYISQFAEFIQLIEPGGTLIYNREDITLNNLVNNTLPQNEELEKIPYSAFSYSVKEHRTLLDTGNSKIPLNIFGKHNMQNLKAAYEVCIKLGVRPAGFFDIISSFRGASRRLQTLAETNTSVVFLDFAHSPSKLEATLIAVKQQYPDRKLIACMELHTFSSLNAGFLSEYAGTMKQADRAIVYFNPHTLEHKKLPNISEHDVKCAFGHPYPEIFTSSEKLVDCLRSIGLNGANLLLMTSGNFGGLNLAKLAEDLV